MKNIIDYNFCMLVVLPCDSCSFHILLKTYLVDVFCVYGYRPVTDFF